MEFSVRAAQAAEMEKIVLFLREAGLNTNGVEEMSGGFFVLEDGEGDIHGTLGIEILGAIGLLRSFAVSREVSEQHLMALFEKSLNEARERGLKEVYLAVNTAASVNLFSLFGFLVMEKGDIPKEIHNSSHGREVLSVDNSVFMMLNLGESG